MFNLCYHKYILLCCMYLLREEVERMTSAFSPIPFVTRHRSGKSDNNCHYSGIRKGRKKRLTTQSGLQSREQRQVLLAQRGQIAANATKSSHSGFRAEGARDLLLHFDHSHIALGLVIVKGHSEVG